jgi:hypothetical protein
MRKLVLLAAGLVALAACNNDSTSPNGNVTGTYSLRTVNGNPLPFTFSDGSVLVSDRLSLNSDGTYVDIATFSNAGTATEQGIWSINNNLISFSDQTDNLSYQGSLSGSVLTESFPPSFSNQSVTEVYQRN